jgi:hypothetical protein
MASGQEDVQVSREPRLLLRYPHLATSQQRWDYLLNCIAERGGPATWANWKKLFEVQDLFANIVGKDLTGRFVRWRNGERKVFTFLQKMAVLKPIADFLQDPKLSWSAYWLESGCEPVPSRGMNAVHVFRDGGGSPVLLTKPSKFEAHGGHNHHDRHLAQAYLKSLRPLPKRGRPSKARTEPIPQITSDGRHDFPPWYRQIAHHRRREKQHRQDWEAWVSEWERKTGKKYMEPCPHLPDVTHEIDDEIRVYGRGAMFRIGIYFKGENLTDF